MKVKTLASIVAVSAITMLGFATPALADTPGPEDPPVIIGPDLDPQLQGSLSVHKYVSPAEDPDLPNNGTAIDSADLVGLTYLNGVTFTLTPITGVNLLTNDGWDDAQAFAADPSSIPVAQLDTDNNIVRVTTGMGTAFFEDLSLGAYLVTETPPLTNDIIIPAAPFVVTIPLPTEVDGVATWLTDVHVYPKNMVSSVSKTVDETGAYSLGDVVSWTVTAVVPGAYGSEAINSFVIRDNLDSRLRFVDGSATAALKNAPAPTADWPLVKDLDFSVSSSLPSGQTGPGGQELAFALLSPALGDLSDFVGGVYTVTFETEVVGVGNGTIPNTPFANVNDSTFTGTPVNTTWGVVDLFKFEKDTTPKKGLEGATFQVFTSATGGTPLQFLVFGVDDDGDPTETWVTDFTTDSNGHVTIPGLRVGVDYWVEETVAPARFQRLTERVQITGLSAQNGIETPLLVEIANIKVPDWELPLTGGSGLLVPLMGFALLAISAGTATAMSRRKSSEL